MCLSGHHLPLICNTSSLCDYSPRLTRSNVCLNYKVYGQRLTTRLLGSQSGAAFKSKVRGVKRFRVNLCCLDGMDFSEAGLKGVPCDGQHIRGKRGGRWVIAFVGGGDKLNKREDKWDPDLPWMPTMLFQLAGCLLQRQDLDTLQLGMIHISSPHLMTFTSVITLFPFYLPFPQI